MPILPTLPSFDFSSIYYVVGYVLLWVGPIVLIAIGFEATGALLDGAKGGLLTPSARSEGRAAYERQAEYSRGYNMAAGADVGMLDGTEASAEPGMFDELED